jgi:predicted metal-dependent hydrolase
MSEHRPEIEIRQQRRKSLVMRVTPAGGVVVLIPRWMKPNHPQVKSFIAEGMSKVNGFLPAETPIQHHDAESIRQLVDEWAAQIGVKPARVQMRTMYRKWGSCSSRGSITLNTALYWLPRHLVEYVVVHELVHLRILDHSPAFWVLLEQYQPDREALERELDTYRI